MNNKKELTSINSRLLQRLAWALILTIGIISFGCQCDCEEATDEYFVRYEVISTRANNAYTLQATVNNEKNNDVSLTFAAGSQWATIIGPVQKGFNASLALSAPTEIIFDLNIYVSKNGSPFAIKANDSSETGRASGQLSYTIDY